MKDSNKKERKTEYEDALEVLTHASVNLGTLLSKYLTKALNAITKDLEKKLEEQEFGDVFEEE